MEEQSDLMKLQTSLIKKFVIAFSDSHWQAFGAEVPGKWVAKDRCGIASQGQLKVISNTNEFHKGSRGLVLISLGYNPYLVR